MKADRYKGISSRFLVNDPSAWDLDAGDEHEFWESIAKPWRILPGTLCAAGLCVCIKATTLETKGPASLSHGLKLTLVFVWPTLCWT